MVERQKKGRMQSVRSIAKFWTNVLQGRDVNMEELSNQPVGEVARTNMRSSQRRVVEWLEVGQWVISEKTVWT